MEIKEIVKFLKASELILSVCGTPYTQLGFFFCNSYVSRLFQHMDKRRNQAENVSL